MEKKNILPIAIDLGAKSTGVFSAFYEKGTELKDLKNKSGKVYDLAKTAYTLLMTARTATRHQRRGLDRKQLVKRLFKLIWEKQLNLEWNDNVQQTLSFLLNRRGFSFLSDTYSVESLSLASDSDEIKTILMEVLKDYEDNNLDDYLQSCIEESSKINELSNIFLQKNLEFKLKKLCADIGADKVTSKSLKNISIDEFQLLEQYLAQYNEALKNGKFTYTDKNDELKELNYFYYDKYNIQAFLKNHSDIAREMVQKFPENLDVWDFNLTNFDLEKNEEKLEDENGKDYIKTHIHHFAFAVYNIKKELDSGSRHRSKYFEEVAEVLRATNHTEPYLKQFCEDLHSGNYTGLNVETLTNLLGNISNLELKPLRKYFNDINHAKGDYWNEQRFAEYYCRWILGEWRVGTKDKDKLAGGKYNYKELCTHIKTKVGTIQDIKNNQAKGSVIECLINLEPCKTIPPYQDNNNRKPPKCQSLILNPAFLDNAYPQWQDFLTDLKKLDSVKNYLSNFKDDLVDLKTGKGHAYFVEQKNSNKQISSGQRDYKDLDARVLQYVFDRVKVKDVLLLNEIYSHAKKLKQNASGEEEKKNASDKLDKAVANSKLSENLKSKHIQGVFHTGTFLHLVCKYFKQRQRARDSRVYIMPEYSYDKKLDKYNNTGRFDDDNQLLTYCHHKPRQKRYQLLNDLAGVLQISPELLVEKAGSDDEASIIDWLKGFQMASYCKSSVDMQKQYRGSLKMVTQSALFKKRLETIKKKPTDEDKSLLQKYANAKPLTADEKKLVKLVENITKASQKMGENLGLDAKELSKFNSIYSFAQIHQIAFAERSGNAKTCAVCSVDNAHRMQMQDDMAKAQRLSAISTRVIDGAVKKIATILARNIADDNWSNITEALKNKQQIHIPIITESNAFEFEPNLAEIKGTKKKDKITKTELFEKKEERIKKSSNGISAYSGNSLGSEKYDGSKEELDHIIPRSGQYGTLNDEANLICVTQEDNQKRGNQTYYLYHLASSYKQTQFGTTDNQAIEEWITETIWDAEKEGFKFGNYHSFINLAPDAQKAFRHALFLADDNAVKQAVIKTINNRNRAFVNGTQRYFAEVLANNIYLRAKKENLDTNKLSFDYFGVETINSAGRGISDLRKFYEFLDDDIKSYTKGDKAQDSYSHLIDAMLAFCITADEHKNDGSIGLNINDEYSLFPFDADSGEVSENDIFGHIKISDSEFDAKSLARRKATEGFNSHRQMTRDGIYAENYLPILVHKNLSEIRKGFTWKNSEEITIYKGKKLNPQQLKNIIFSLNFTDKNIDININTLDDLKAILTENNIPSTLEYFYINLKTHKIHAYYIENYNTGLGYKKYSEEMQFLRGLAYRTERTKIQTIDDVKKILSEGKKFKVGTVHLPFKQEWQKLYGEWQKTTIKNDYEFLKAFFGVTNNTKQHNKIRKDFSLPISTAEGKFLMQRKSWDNKPIYQILNDSDSRADGAKPFIPAFEVSTNEIVEAIVNSFASKNIFWLPKNVKLNRVDDKNIYAIDTGKWFSIDVIDELKNINITKIEYKIDNNTRPKVKVTLSDLISDENFQCFKTHQLLKPRYPEKLDDLLKLSTIFEFEGSGLNNSIKEALKKPLKEYYCNETSSSQ